MKRAQLLGAVLVTGLAAIPAHATLLGLASLNPGGSVAPGNATNGIQTITGYSTTCPPSGASGVTVPKFSAPPSTLKIAAGSTVVADTCDETTIANNGSSAVGSVTLREVVARESGTNTLDFYYQASFTPNAAGIAGGWGVSRIFGVPFTANPPDSVGNYTAANLLGSGGSASTLVVDNLNKSSGAGFAGGGPCTNSAGVSTNKDCVTFDFSPTQLTDVVVVSTSDQLFNTTIAKTDMGLDLGANNGASGTDYFYGYAPLAGSVPEPVSIVLLGSVLAFSAFFIRRRKSAKNESSVS